jgi:integrase/recombinase XerC
MIRIEDFLTTLQRQKNFSELTVQSYRIDLEAFYKYIGVHYDVIEWIDVEDFHIRSWFAEMIESGLKPSTIKRKKASLSSFFKFMLVKKYVQRNPVKLISTPKPAKRLPEFVPEKNMQILLENDFFDIKTYEQLLSRMILETLYATGIRASELVELKNQSIDIARLTIKIQGKGSKERLLPVHPEFVKMIEHFQKVKQETFVEENTSEYFFVTTKGKKMYRELAYRMISSCLSGLSSISKKSPHILRHTFATHLLNEGAELNAIKELLGHANLSATQLYTHNTIEKLKTVYKETHPQSKKRRTI